MPLNIVGATVKLFLKYRNIEDIAKYSLLYKQFSVFLSVHLPAVRIQFATCPSKPEKGQSSMSADVIRSQIRVQASFTTVLQGDSSVHSSPYCVNMHAAILQATAEIRAAPRPLPSSDWMKEISQ